jgi:rhomboid family GlyGly-CTERM serine protease
MLAFGSLIFALNLPLLFGSGWHALMFQPEAVRHGQWWRLLTHPFVHVTWYHLLLDGSAFFILYHSLIELSLGKRLAYLVGGAVGSVTAAWASSGSASGLCGLSGIAHGLMAVSALELVSSQPSHSAEWRVGLATFAFVVGKAMYEALSGHMFFAILDFGLLGDPISVSHAGGIVGALVLMLACRCVRWNASTFFRYARSIGLKCAS